MKNIALFLSLFSFGLGFSQHHPLKESINSILKNKHATVGIAIIYDGKDTLTVNNQYLYPMMSVVKFHQGLAALDYMEKNAIPLSKEYFIKPSDLATDTYSPLRDKFPKGNFNIPISELLRFCIAESDNNVSNYFFKHITSPKQTEEYIQGLGVADISIRKTEGQMQVNHAEQYLNWTRPLAMAVLLEKLEKGDFLTKEHQDFMMKTLLSTATGTNKIKGLLPKEIEVAHKTGNSYRDNGIKAADNDAGIIFLPNGTRLTLVVFVMNSRLSDDENAKITAEIAKVAFDYYSKK